MSSVDFQSYGMGFLVERELLEDNSGVQHMLNILRRYAEAVLDRMEWDVITLPDWLSFNARLRAYFAYGK